MNTATKTGASARKPTPAPWYLTHEHPANIGHVQKMFAFPTEFSIDTPFGQIRCVQAANPGLDTQEANARLLATAPELLAMCQNALEALEGLSESNACMSDFERACIPALKSAIAKAL